MSGRLEILFILWVGVISSFSSYFEERLGFSF